VPRLSARSGTPGARVTLSGTLPLYDETGHLDPRHPTKGFQVWWNLDFARWWPARPGPVMRLLGVAVPVPNPCTYRMTVTVPHVQPGTYRVDILQIGGGGASSLEPLGFKVTG
jgi:hypothetical protein